MEQKILQNAAEMFLNYGFKSVTMDDIANTMGISKKTIYQYYENKNKLVEATTMYVFENISHGIDCICEIEKNPIEEVY
ncbi:MAG: TetR/AcrR family transcriptional regulator, partial [Mangrovimonas sp.]|nr:TetR/AcrR family transcriptional regulator [Mangrovimonas sp.]